MVNFLVNAPRWLLLGALVYAPWAYGCTRPWTVCVLDSVLALIVFLWLAGCAIRRARPVVPRVLLVAGLALATQSWWMVFNAKSEYDTATLQYLPLQQWLAWAPGSLHKSLSLQLAFHVSAMLAAGLFCCDLARRTLWRKRLLLTMVVTGISLIVLGLSQRLTGATGIFWAAEDVGRTFFATYRYHANAGSFINLVWPLVGGFFLIALRKEASSRERVLWGASLILCLAGVFVNASRAANVIALGLLGLSLGIFLWKRYHQKEEPAVKPTTIIAVSLSLIIMLTGVAAFGGLDTTWRRWSKFDQELSARNPRLLVAQVCMNMLPEAGCWGFGPGVFKTVFPYYTSELGDEISGVWEYAHDDYLQTLVEWGFVGGAFWCIYLLGGLFLSLRMLARSRSHLAADDQLILFALWAAMLGVLLHAGMDYPLQVGSIQVYVLASAGILWSCRSWAAKHHSRIRLPSTRISGSRVRKAETVEPHILSALCR